MYARAMSAGSFKYTSYDKDWRRLCWNPRMTEAVPSPMMDDDRIEETGDGSPVLNQCDGSKRWMAQDSTYGASFYLSSICNGNIFQVVQVLGITVVWRSHGILAQQTRILSSRTSCRPMKDNREYCLCVSGREIGVFDDRLLEGRLQLVPNPAAV